MYIFGKCQYLLVKLFGKKKKRNHASFSTVTNRDDNIVETPARPTAFFLRGHLSFPPSHPLSFLTEHYPDELVWEGHSACASVAHPAQEIKQNPGFPGRQVCYIVIRSFLVTHRYEPEM